jgi:streptolysin S family bacteriocin protoxin
MTSTWPVAGFERICKTQGSQEPPLLPLLLPFTSAAAAAAGSAVLLLGGIACCCCCCCCWLSVGEGRQRATLAGLFVALLITNTYSQKQ